jgi:hypothetical protein
LQRVGISFIEWEHFQDKKRNLVSYEKDIAGFYLQRVVMPFIEGELFQDKRRNMTLYKSLPSIVFTGSVM